MFTSGCKVSQRVLSDEGNLTNKRKKKTNKQSKKHHHNIQKVEVGVSIMPRRMSQYRACSQTLSASCCCVTATTKNGPDKRERENWRKAHKGTPIILWFWSSSYLSPASLISFPIRINILASITKKKKKERKCMQNPSSDYFSCLKFNITVFPSWPTWYDFMLQFKKKRNGKKNMHVKSF